MQIKNLLFIFIIGLIIVISGCENGVVGKKISGKPSIKDSGYIAPNPTIIPKTTTSTVKGLKFQCTCTKNVLFKNIKDSKGKSLIQTSTVRVLYNNQCSGLNGYFISNDKNAAQWYSDCRNNEVDDIITTTSSSTTTTTTLFSNKCPEGFVLDTYDKSFITNDYICKPKLMNMVGSEDINDFLNDKIFGLDRTYTDWKTYPPLVNKVNELIRDRTNDLDKVKAIANWVYKSKDYACPGLSTIQYCDSPANLNKNFSVIFNTDKGVCWDAAILTTAMLRTAGIPSYPMFAVGLHALTGYYLDGKWYAIDTTFCIDKTQCPDLVFMTPEQTNKRIYFIFNKLGHIKDPIKNKYCENNFCMDHPFQTHKIMPLNNRSSEAELIYPAFRNAIINNKQIECALNIKDLVCSLSKGCEFTNLVYERQYKNFNIGYEIEDLRNIGIIKVKLPSKYISGEGLEIPVIYRYVCYQNPEEKMVAYREFNLNKDVLTKINVDDLIKAQDFSDDDFNKLKEALKSSADF